MARAATTTKNTAKNVIFFKMKGAPSHTDTFDLKATNPFPRTFNPTPYNGLLWPQGLMPKLADQLDSIALVRSARAYANVHGLMQTWLQIGRNPSTPTAKISPHIGSVAAIELTRKDAILPTFVALNGNPRAASSFLPVAHPPFSFDGWRGFTKHFASRWCGPLRLAHRSVARRRERLRRGP